MEFFTAVELFTQVITYVMIAAGVWVQFTVYSLHSAYVHIWYEEKQT